MPFLFGGNGQLGKGGEVAREGEETRLRVEIKNLKLRLVKIKF